MTEIALIISKISGLLFTFYLSWSGLVLGAVGKMDAKSAEARRPSFAVRGKGIAKASAAVMIVPGVYVIWTRSVDTFVFATASVGLLIGAFAFWQVATSLGSYACETEANWRETKFKTYLQAFGLVLLVIALNRGRAYFESNG